MNNLKNAFKKNPFLVIAILIMVTYVMVTCVFNGIYTTPPNRLKIREI